MMTMTSGRTTMRRRLWILSACAAASVLGHHQVIAQSGGPAAKSCDSLASLALPNARITMARPVAAGAFVPPGPPPVPVSMSYKGLLPTSPCSRLLQGGVRRTRPLCAYPQIARYRGTGSTDDERNFECGPPAH